MPDDIKKTLWSAADKLRANMDAAAYKHIVLGLIFLKTLSDSIQPGPAPSPEQEDGNQDDTGRRATAFQVPEAARWERLVDYADAADIGRRIDDALAHIESANPALRGILDKRYAHAQLPHGRLGELVRLIATISHRQHPHGARDLLGEVYEYFLGEFASAEGRKGGQFYTPACVVKTLVDVLAPHHGKVYDPCCGSGGMFVQSERFIAAHGGRPGDVTVYGQESNPTTWRLAAMNLALRGIEFHLGAEAADTFTRNQHPQLRADFVLANPPFNVSDWWHADLAGDPRWSHGTPPPGNANYAWLQHVLHHLAPHGRAGVVLANGSMSSTQAGEAAIRRALVEHDRIEAMVALPAQLFFNTQIPACLWFMAKQKRVRQGEVLFIDARRLGRAIGRVRLELGEDDIGRIAGTVHAWRGDGDARAHHAPHAAYADIPGFCRSVAVDEIAAQDYVLSPARYVEAAAAEDDGTAFDDTMRRLTARLREQMTQGAEQDTLIRECLGRLGYAL